MAVVLSSRRVACKILKSAAGSSIPSQSASFIFRGLQNTCPRDSSAPSSAARGAAFTSPVAAWNPPPPPPNLHSFSAIHAPESLRLNLRLIRLYSDSSAGKIPRNPSSDPASAGSPDRDPRDSLDPSKPPEPGSDENPGFQHQEIEGPTVERDLSALGNETREVLGGMMKTIYSLSRATALLGALQLGLGAWSWYAAPPAAAAGAWMAAAAAAAFPVLVAIVLRQLLKPMLFFKKMEEQGRLQILTLALQVAKSLDTLFGRFRWAAYLCSAGTAMAFLVSLPVAFRAGNGL